MTPEQIHEQRGLTLISALINFVDWLDTEARTCSRRGVSLLPCAETERAQLVLKFFDAHSKGENYFMQADQIMEILGKPFRRRDDTRTETTSQRSRRESPHLAWQHGPSH